MSRRRRFRFGRPKNTTDSTDRRTDGRTMLFPTTLRVLARRGGGPRGGRGSLMSSPFLEVCYILIVIERERMCFFFFLFLFVFQFDVVCGIEFSPRCVALLEEDVFKRERERERERERKVSVSSFESLSLSRFRVSDATLTFFSPLRLRNNRAVVCSSNSSSSSIDRVLGLDLTGGDDIIAKVSGAVDGAKRVRAHPRVLKDVIGIDLGTTNSCVAVMDGKRESYRKRGRVKDDAVHGLYLARKANG